MSIEYDPKRRRPYTTGELARLFETSTPTMGAWIDAGMFGREGYDWWWTPAGKGKGYRRVAARAVHRVIERGG